MNAPTVRVLPMLGTTRREIDCGCRLHPVPAEEVTRKLIDDIETIADGGWYAVVMFSDGRGAMRGLTETARLPPQDALDRMVDLAVLLNRDNHHNGHWVIIWSNERINMIWRALVTHGADADRQDHVMFDVGLDEPWSRARLWSLEEMAERAEAGYAGAREYFGGV